MERMKIQDQCCTLEQAKRLKELGVAQKAIFAWFDDMNTCGTPVFSNASQYHCPTCCNEAPAGYEEFSAFTGVELGSMLPFRILWNDDDYFPQMHKGKNGWYIQYQTNKKDVAITAEGELDRPRAYLFNTFRANHNMAKSYAGYLILLLESDAITVDDVNSRL
jgi:hypothetical protein